MTKISLFKPGSLTALSAALMFVAIFALTLFVSTQTVAAQQLSTSELQKKAEAFCKTGDDRVKSACRNGYRSGYNNKPVEDACVKRDIYEDKHKQSCRKGYIEGQQLAASSGPGGRGADQCGKGGEVVTTKFNFGCLGEESPQKISPIEDFMYAIIRFLSVGVGLAIVLAIIVSGIQYSISEGNPEATQAAKSKIQSAVIALFIYLFTFALVQYLVPGGVFAGTMIVPDALPDIIRTITI